MTPQASTDIQKLIDASTDNEEKELFKWFPEMSKSLIDVLDAYENDLEDAQEHFKQLLNYNLLRGEKISALTMLRSYRDMVPNATEQDLRLVCIIAWCSEMHMASFRLTDEMVFDRVVDGEGRPCYHRVRGTGLEVSNDAYYLECSAYVLLQKHIKDRKKLVAVEPMFRKAAKQRVIGQNILQTTHYPKGEVDFSVFTDDLYNSYVKYGTSCCSFDFPLKFSMFWAGINDSEGLQNVEDVAFKLGHFAQVKNDFLNCYGSKEVFGKSGSNIALNKICWLIVKALEKADSKQKEILKANYGQPDRTCIDKVKAVYNDLDLKGAFREFEKKTHRELATAISKLRDDLPKQTLMDTATRIQQWEDKLYF